MMDDEDIRDSKELMSQIHSILIDADEKLHRPFEKLGFDEAYFDVSVSLAVKVNDYEVRVKRVDKKLGF